MNSAVRNCAVYTRKSTEEGLDQNFNSLDAQREACLAYIASQKAEGWMPLIFCARSRINACRKWRLRPLTATDYKLPLIP